MKRVLLVSAPPPRTHQNLPLDERIPEASRGIQDGGLRDRPAQRDAGLGAEDI